MKSPSDQPAETWWGRLTRPQRAAAIGGGVLVLTVVLALMLGGGEPKETKTTVLTNGLEEQPLETANPRPEIWKNPVVLFAGADDSVDRYDPAVTDGGLTLVFVAGLPQQGADLYLSTRVRPNDEWGDPQPLASLNTDADELGPAFSSDGKFLFFSSDREGGQGGYDLWVSRNEDGEWSAPVNLGPGINTALDEIDPFIRRPMDEPGNTGNRLHPAGLYYASNQPAEGEPPAQLPRWRGTARVEPVPQSENFDIFLARIEAEETAEARPWTFVQPERLAHLNTPGRDAMPAVTQLGDLIYFASTRAVGAGGFDLFSARWHPEAHRAPQSLGAPVNTAANDTDPALFDDGHHLIFSSDRGAGEAPIFQLFATHTTPVIPVEHVAEIAPRASTGGFWNFLHNNWLWLLLLILALLALLSLLKNFLDEERRRALSLLQRCLLGSLALHILMAIILLFITITAEIFPDQNQPPEEELLELALNEGTLAVQQMSREIREAVPELPPAEANLPVTEAAQPAAVAVQNPASEPARPVPVQPETQPQAIVIESPEVRVSPITPEALADFTQPLELPELTQPQPQPVKLEQTRAQARPDRALANFQPRPPVNPAANAQAEANPQAVSPRTVDAAQPPTASNPLAAAPEMAAVSPAILENPDTPVLPNAPSAQAEVPQEQATARAQANQKLPPTITPARPRAVLTQDARANPQATSQQEIQPAKAEKASAPTTRPAPAQAAAETVQAAQARNDLPQVSAVKTNPAQEQGAAQAQAANTLAQAKAPADPRAAPVQNAKANPLATSQQPIQSAQAAKATTQTPSPVEAQAAAEPIQTALAQAVLPQQLAAEAPVMQEQGEARRAMGSVLAQVNSQPKAQASPAQAARVEPQATSQRPVQTAPAAKVASAQIPNPVKAQAEAGKIQAAPAKSSLPRVETAQANAPTEQAAARADAGSSLATAKGSQIPQAAAVGQMPAGEPLTTELEPVKSAQASATAAVQPGKINVAQEANVRLAAATSSPDLLPESKSPEAVVKLEAARSNSQANLKLTAAKSTVVKAAAPESQPQDQPGIHAAKAPAVKVPKQVAKAVLTDVAPALATAPAGKLNTAQSSPSQAAPPVLAANAGALEQAQPKSQAGQGRVTVPKTTPVQAAQGSPDSAVIPGEMASATAVKAAIRDVKLAATAGPVSAPPQSVEVPAAQVKAPDSSVRVGGQTTVNLETIEPTVAVGKQLDGVGPQPTLAPARPSRAQSEAQRQGLPMVAAVGLKQIFKPNLKPAPAAGTAPSGRLASAKAAAPGISTEDLAPVEVDSLDGDSAASRVAGKGLKAAKGGLSFQAGTNPAPANGAGPVATKPAVQSEAVPRLGGLQLAALPALELNAEPLALPGTGREVVLPAMQINPGVVLEVPEQAINPLILRENPKLRLDYIERLGGSEETEKAVLRALDWFTRNQEKNGCWRGEAGHYTAATGMAMLAYMGWGAQHTKPGPYQKPLARAVDWMLREEFNGDLRGRSHRGNMYDHGIAAIAMAEAYALTKDPRLLEPMKRVVAFTVRAQNPKTGGWRYQTHQENPKDQGDMSVTGWQLMALKSAELGGLAVPKQSFDRARSFLDFVGTGKHRADYRYIPKFDRREAMIAEGLFCQQLLGLNAAQPRMRESVKYLQRKMPSRRNINYYYWYYGSLAMHQNQGAPWEEWNKRIRPILIRNQVRKDRREDGSWDPVGQWGSQSGRCVTTAMATLSLEVYYRYLPLSSPEWLKRGGLNRKTGGDD